MEPASACTHECDESHCSSDLISSSAAAPKPVLTLPRPGRVQHARSRLSPSIPIVAFSLGLGGVLLAIDLSGVNRGEVTRLWISLACFFQIPAAYACARLQSRAAVMLILGTTLLQDALGASMIAFVLPRPVETTARCETSYSGVAT